MWVSVSLKSRKFIPYHLPVQIPTKLRRRTLITIKPQPKIFFKRLYSKETECDKTWIHALIYRYDIRTRTTIATSAWQAKVVYHHYYPCSIKSQLSIPKAEFSPSNSCFSPLARVWRCQGRVGSLILPPCSLSKGLNSRQDDALSVLAAVSSFRRSWKGHNSSWYILQIVHRSAELK